MRWQSVSVQPHWFGGIEFRLGKRELGHLHGDSLLDVPFPRSVRNELVASGRTEEHHIMPESGWVSFRIRSQADVDQAIVLLRRSYDFVMETRVRSTKTFRVTQQENKQS